MSFVRLMLDPSETDIADKVVFVSLAHITIVQPLARDLTKTVLYLTDGKHLIVQGAALDVALKLGHVEGLTQEEQRAVIDRVKAERPMSMVDHLRAPGWMKP